MSEREVPSKDEQLPPGVYDALAKAGWRPPQTPGEVAAAEQWVEQAPTEVPSRLREVPEPELSAPAPERAGGILERYFTRDVSADRERSPDKDGPDLDR